MDCFTPLIQNKGQTRSFRELEFAFASAIKAFIAPEESLMGSCGCSGGMKDGRPCTCANCQKRYGLTKSIARRQVAVRNFNAYNRKKREFGIRKIGGQKFTILPEAGTAIYGHGMFDAKSILQQRAAALRLKGYNARVIRLAGGYTLWTTNKVRFSQEELNYAERRLGANSPQFKQMLVAHRDGGGTYRIPTGGSRATQMAVRRNQNIYGHEKEDEIRDGADYKLGDMWADTFDYEGMLNKGAFASLEGDSPMTLDDLKKLFESYQDVNYHTAAKPLWEAIQILEMADKDDKITIMVPAKFAAEEKLKEFRIASRGIGRPDVQPPAVVGSWQSEDY